MKDLLDQLDKTFDNRVRLGIMAVLVTNESVDFNELKRLLGVTDGNLSGNVSVLRKKKYLDVNKQFINNKPNTSYTATDTGRDAFRRHIDALEKIAQIG